MAGCPTRSTDPRRIVVRRRVGSIRLVRTTFPRSAATADRGTRFLRETALGFIAAHCRRGWADGWWGALPPIRALGKGYDDARGRRLSGWLVRRRVNAEDRGPRVPPFAAWRPVRLSRSLLTPRHCDASVSRNDPSRLHTRPRPAHSPQRSPAEGPDHGRRWRDSKTLRSSPIRDSCTFCRPRASRAHSHLDAHCAEVGAPGR